MYAWFTLNIIRRNRRVMVSVNRRWPDACIFPPNPRAAEPRPLKTTSRELYRQEKDDEQSGSRRREEKKSERKREERNEAERKEALKRAVASPRHGIYDVISSLTVNNFPRGCAEDTIASAARLRTQLTSSFYPTHLLPAPLFSSLLFHPSHFV